MKDTVHHRLLNAMLVALLLLGLRCASESEQPSAESPPAQAAEAAAPGSGDSELTLLMRDMEANVLQVRQEILDESPELSLRSFDGLLAATPTPSKAEKIADPYFATCGQEYARLAASLADMRNREERGLAFNQMVDACMTCHQTFCPGPTARIKKLYLPGEKASQHSQQGHAH